MSDYQKFIYSKSQLCDGAGFDPVFMPDYLMDFQHALVEWAVRKGRAAIFADCGMGKTVMQLVWAWNVAHKTGKRVLILTPLAVSSQTVREANQFGMDCYRSGDGSLGGCPVIVTNYERLHLFNPTDFVGMVCDESSILKSFDGVRRGEITQFMRKLPYRLLCTATAAPNDYVELGTSSEALGYLGHMDMLNRFFKNDLNNSATGRAHGKVIQWRFKGHAEEAFWKFVVSWARAVRKPSDLGFDDARFILPELIENEHVVVANTLADGMLFALPAVGLDAQREETRRTLQERCEKAAALVTANNDFSLSWCHLNPEGDLLEKLIPGSVQISGDDSDDAKEDKFLAFVTGQIKNLITKYKIGAWGLNFQHCAHQTTFPSHSYEQYYQGTRRCWRFGQKRPVVIDIVRTEGQQHVMENQQRKAHQAGAMFERLVERMNEQLHIERGVQYSAKEEVPAWL
jgi:hypothetical protein